LLNRQGNGRYSKIRSASRVAFSAWAGSVARKPATASAAGTSTSAAGSPLVPGATASQIARSVRCSVELSPGAFLQPGAAASTRPASDQSRSEAKTRDPSTMPLSR
jgi:hypothetical protein